MDEDVLRLFADLPLQGPGSDADTVAVIEAVRSRIPIAATIVDFGCGSGRSTLVLLREFPAATLWAIDAAALSIERLTAEAKRQGVEGRLRPVVDDMLASPIEPVTIDLIWSEGAVYAVGFETALRAWRPLLRDSGMCVVSDCEWLSDDRPPQVAGFWREMYPDMGDRTENIRRAADADFDVLATHILSDDGWVRYYAALARALEAAGTETFPPAFTDGIAEEIRVWRNGRDSFGYVFYILQPR